MPANSIVTACPPAMSRLARWRDIGRLSLMALLVISGVFAWHMSTTLQEQTQGLNRYIRVDLWTARQAEHHLQNLLLRLAQERLNDPYRQGTVDDHIDRADRALSRLESTHSDVGLAHVLNIQAAVDSLTERMDDIRRAARQGIADDDRYQAERSLTETLPLLHQLLVDLTQLRLQLQDKDVRQIQDLVSLNNTMVIGFYGLVAIFSCFLWWESDGAKRASRQALANEERFKDIAEIASDWVWETDQHLRLSYISERIEEAVGILAEDHLGKPFSGFFTEPTTATKPVKLAGIIQKQEPFREIIAEIGENANKEALIVRMSGKPVFDIKGRFLGYRGVASDISLAMRREARIRYLAEHDQLTGLANRLVFQDKLRTVLNGFADARKTGTLLALDLDGFKDINDTFGHDVGDALILTVADCLSSLVRSTDLLARLGGDEFALVCLEDEESLSPDDLAQRILDAFVTPFSVEGKQLSVGVSIGIARFPDDGATVEDLMKASDLALYGAKAQGRGCFIHFDRQMTLQLKQKRTIEASLKRALDHGELDIAFQPQIDLRSQELVGAEALARWHDEDLGSVPPDVFIRIAEACGLILPLGQWVLEAACAEARGWAENDIDAVVAVNLSPAQLTQQDLVHSVEQALKRADLPPARLELEITESLLMGDTQTAISTLENLRDLGVQLAIDDFGTGYSSLSYLKRFSVHKVKIDRSFVTDLERDEEDRCIVNAIVMLGRALNLRTIAEGVETTAQSRLLTSLGCHEAQGYLYGRPMASTAFRSYCLARGDHEHVAALPGAGNQNAFSQISA